MIKLCLDANAYSLEAVQKAAYRFIDRLTVQIETEQGAVICAITPVKPDANIDQLIDDFKRELLDQELRLKIKTETEQVRNLILALAFSRSGLQE